MLVVDFINVGYGDAVLIRETSDSSGSFTMLVDSGDLAVASTGISAKHLKSVRPASDVCVPSMRISAAEFLQKMGIERLDLLVITHLHRDHVGGLIDLLPKLQVSELWCNYVPEPTFWGRQANIPRSFSLGARHLLEALNIYSQALKTLSENDSVIRCIRGEQTSLQLGEGLEASLICEEAETQQEDIWKRAFEGKVSSQELDVLNERINDSSLRMCISYAGQRIELPGDFSTGWELSAQPCTIVKLPHHGHPDSLNEPLADALRAYYTVISVSNSRNDCPREEIVALSRRHSPYVLFTDAVVLPGISPTHHASIRFLISEDGRILVEDYCYDN